MTKKTQNEKILQHLKNHGSITSMEAFMEYGCTRLSARIRDLREEGHSIAAIRETGRNRDGGKVTYARYWMRGAE